MGQKAKKQAAARRASMKRARKDAQQKQYQSWRDQGINQLSRRSKLNAKRATKLITQRHKELICGNLGCEKEFPSLARPRMNDSFDERVREAVNIFAHQKASSKPWTTSLEKLAHKQRQRFLNEDRPLSQSDTRRLMAYLNVSKEGTYIYGPRLARSLIVNTPVVKDPNRPLAKPMLKQLMALLNLSEKEAKAYPPQEAREKLANA